MSKFENGTHDHKDFASSSDLFVSEMCVFELELTDLHEEAMKDEEVIHEDCHTLVLALNRFIKVGYII